MTVLFNEEVPTKPIRIFDSKYLVFETENRHENQLIVKNPTDPERHIFKFSESDFPIVQQNLNLKKTISFQTNELFYLVSQSIEKESLSKKPLNTPPISAITSKMELKTGKEIWQRNAIFSRVNYETCGLKSQASH